MQLHNILVHILAHILLTFLVYSFDILFCSGASGSADVCRTASNRLHAGEMAASRY